MEEVIMKISDLAMNASISPDTQSRANIESDDKIIVKSENPEPNRTQESSVRADSHKTRHMISPQKLAANRANAQRSTGPTTAAGKRISSWNSLRHGLLSNRLIEFDEQKKKQFSNLLESLQQDLEPVGALEQVLVEKIAHEYWRLGMATYYENQVLPGAYLDVQGIGIANLIRYEAMINHQLFQAINQLERLQRLRQGETVLAPVTVQLSHDHSIVSQTEESSE
jgi:hypothetical protein